MSPHCNFDHTSCHRDDDDDDDDDDGDDDDDDDDDAVMKGTQGQKRYPKELEQQRFCELSGELSGAICLTTLVLLGSALELFRSFFGAVRVSFLGCGVLVWPLGNAVVLHCTGQFSLDIVQESTEEVLLRLYCKDCHIEKT